MREGYCTYFVVCVPRLLVPLTFLQHFEHKCKFFVVSRGYSHGEKESGELL